jgi:hypothetical protein
MSKKQKKAARKQLRRQHKQEIAVDYSNAATASIQEAAATVDALSHGDDAKLLLSYLSHIQCMAHSSLAQALLLDCSVAAATASTARSSQPLAQHAAQSGHFGRSLQQHAAAASLSPQLTNLWAGVLLGLPVTAAASISTVDVLLLDDLDSSLQQGSSENERAACASQLKVLLLLEDSCVDAAASPAALVMQQQPGQLPVVHVFADSSTMPDVMDSLHAWAKQHQEQTAVAQHLLSTGGDDEAAEAQGELLHLLGGKIRQLVMSSTNSYLQAHDMPAAAEISAHSLLAAAMQQQSVQEQVKLLQQAQQLLHHLQDLQDCLAEVSEAADVCSAAAAAKQKLLAWLRTSVYSLRSQAQEVEQHVGQLHDRYFSVTSLAGGERMLRQLQALAAGKPRHTLELRRLREVVKQQMGSADMYLQYSKLVSSLRVLCKLTSQHVQRQTNSSLLAGQEDAVEKLYMCAPSAAASLLQLCTDVLGSFVVSSSSIRLVRQHSLAQLQLHDQQLAVTLQQLLVRQSTIEKYGYAGLLASFEQLLTAAPDTVEASSAQADSSPGERLGPRTLMLDNAVARLQQKQEMLAGLADQLARLLAEAQGVKPSPRALVSCRHVCCPAISS